MGVSLIFLKKMWKKQLRNACKSMGPKPTVCWQEVKLFMLDNTMGLHVSLALSQQTCCICQPLNGPIIVCFFDSQPLNGPIIVCLLSKWAKATSNSGTNTNSHTTAATTSSRLSWCISRFIPERWSQHFRLLESMTPMFRSRNPYGMVYIHTFATVATSIHTYLKHLYVAIAASSSIIWAMKKPWLFAVYTTQLYRDYNKPL